MRRVGRDMAAKRKTASEWYERTVAAGICMNCNWARRFGATCPHETEASHGG